MFVTELDRPWSDTPFLVQGFLVTEADDLTALRALCLEVEIDPRRSATDSLHELIDLYDISKLEPINVHDPSQVRVRYVEHGRYQTEGSSLPWISLGKLRETVTRGFHSLQTPSRR